MIVSGVPYQPVHSIRCYHALPNCHILITSDMYFLVLTVPKNVCGFTVHAVTCHPGIHVVNIMPTRVQVGASRNT